MKSMARYLLLLVALLSIFSWTACANTQINQSADAAKPDASDTAAPSAPVASTDGDVASNEKNKLNVIEIGDTASYPVAADYTPMFGAKDKLPEPGDFGYDVRSTDLSKADLSGAYAQLLEATYDSKTIWPEKMPENFDPAEIMKLYQDPGLNVRQLHSQGITGEGIGIAIIDQPLLLEHVEYADRLRYYAMRESVSQQSAAMHGPAVASIAVGKSVGVAPGADLYYIADDFFQIKDNHALLAESINRLLDMNKPLKNKIRVISISWGMDREGTPGLKELNKAYARAKEEGVLVLTTSFNKREDMEFFGLDKIPLSDANDYQSYTKNMYGQSGRTYNISAPMNFRCVAAPSGKGDYVVYREGGKSWATPYVAGLYALACQVKPEITYDEFWILAAKTARTTDGAVQGKSAQANYIVDPIAIIDELRK